jgi:O-antigen ligase
MDMRVSRYVIAYVSGLLAIICGSMSFCSVVGISDGVCYPTIVLFVVLFSTILLDQYNWKKPWYSDDE